MNKPPASEAATIAKEISSAFSGVTKPTSVAVGTISNEDADEIIEHILRFTDDVQNFYLPQILGLTILSDMAEASRVQRIQRVVDLLDVDFEEQPPGIDKALKDIRTQTFSSYSVAQSRALYRWLEFVRSNYGSSLFNKEIESALNYWRTRAETTRIEEKGKS
jgi:hypothetical protein